VILEFREVSMPVIKAGKPDMPPWCKLRRFSPFSLEVEGTRKIPFSHEKAVLVVTEGRCVVESGDLGANMRELQFMLATRGTKHFSIRWAGIPATAMLFEGNWEGPIAGAGTFQVTPDSPRKYQGDPFTYPKSTTFDNHYHDYDEYWIVLAGGGTVAIDEVLTAVGVGDCVAIGMGLHHDVSKIDGELRAAYFEGQIEGRGRLGHLWEHTHGKAEPCRARL
jgi:mannose-6-phosphate isomerase-like protein (cupin superfamily)